MTLLDKALDQEQPISLFPQRTNILALDVATNCGWCTYTASGTWNLTPKKDESKGMRLIRFKAKLREICELEKIGIIVFEQLATYGKFPNFIGAEMQGVLKLFCTENNIEYKSYAPTVIKKFGTGKGNAKKNAMVEAAKRYNPSVASDDEADAIILYQLAIDDLKLKTTT
jgi:Holliday junction resolvasome RuvABC endonuclease subunit